MYAGKRKTAKKSPLKPKQKLPLPEKRAPIITVAKDLIAVQTKPENVLKQSKDGHELVMLKRTRVKGFCVECIKQNKDPLVNYKKHLTKIITHCPKCPGKFI